MNSANLVYLEAGEEERKPIRTTSKIAPRAPSVTKKKSESVESPRPVPIHVPPRTKTFILPVRAELSTAGPVPSKKLEEEKRTSQAENSISAYYGRVRQVLKIENYSFEVILILYSGCFLL